MNSRFNINDRGFWETDNEIGHVFDKELCSVLIKYFKLSKVKSIYDFGCGMGHYAGNFIKNDFICEAFDGNPNTVKLTEGIGKVLDLSLMFDFRKKFDCVLSLEVGEHIPEAFEKEFINNLCNHSKKLVILSWAVPGQPGDGHINCRDNDYVINEMNKRGFAFNKKASGQLRTQASASWFKNTLMVFDLKFSIKLRRSLFFLNRHV
jgi:hypothetical protein